MARDGKPEDANGTVHHVSERQKRKKDRPRKPMQPPLTPMIDVTFQLLIFFLLACDFRYTEGQIEATLPNVSGPQAAPDLKHDPISVTLSPAGIDGEGVSIEVSEFGTANGPQELFDMLVRQHDRYGDDADDVPVLIKPTQGVWWTHVVNAFNQAVRSRFKKIAFAPAGT